MIARACLLAVLACAPLEPAASAAPARGPLTEAEIVFLLQSGVTTARLRSLVARHGIDFELSPKLSVLMREAGADDGLLQALRRGAAPSPPAARAPGPASALEPDLSLVPGGPRGDLYLGRFEVSNRQYLTFCSRTFRRAPPAPYWGLLDRYPVVNVSWHDAVAFCRWLSRQTGRSYRLPTAVEWEHAARGGERALGAYPWGDEDPLGRSCFGKGLLCPVGSYPPSNYGLHDMAGSVAEWCADGQAGRRYIKGGSWASPLVAPEALAIARREGISPDKVRIDVGFRVARDP